MVRTRFAPSPTGFLHIGGLRTAVYAYALAKHGNGNFLLRIEDTDQKREVAGAKEKIYSLLKIFGINWDELHIQSVRSKQGVYLPAVKSLLNSGHAFYCQCEGRNPKKGSQIVTRDPCRDKNFTSGAVKIKIPDDQTVFYHDFVLNTDITWNTNDVQDATLLKSDGFPTYHLAVVVDDSEMEITHVFRAAEWIPSTPIHLLLYQYLNLKPPQFGHPTDILDPQGGKLSKRKDNVSVEQFIADGYLPDALFNFVILLGWAPKDNRELFTLSEFVEAIDINGFQKSNPQLNLTKLDWFNGQYIRQKSDTELTQLVKPYVKNKITDTKLAQIIPLIKDRLVKLSDINSLTQFFFNPPQPDKSLFSDTSPAHLSDSLPVISQSGWTKEEIESNLKNLINLKGWKVGDYFMSLRIAICGSRSTPPITETMIILGKEETEDRIKNAIHNINHKS